MTHQSTGSYLTPPHSETDPRSPHHGYTKAMTRLRESVAASGGDFDSGVVTRGPDSVHPDREDMTVVNLAWAPEAAPAKRAAPKKKAAAK